MEKIDAETIHEIVKKLVGEIDPVGCGSRDPERFKNLGVMTDVIDKLILGIQEVHTHNKNSYESSVKHAADKARKYLYNLGDDLHVQYPQLDE